MFTKEDNEPKPNPPKNVASVIHTAFSVVATLIALIGIPQYFPSFKDRIIIALLIFVIVLFLAYGSILTRVYNVLKKKRKERNAIKVLAAKFSDLVNQFKNISADNRCNSIRSCLKAAVINNSNISSLIGNDYWFDTLFSTFDKSYFGKLTSKPIFYTHVLWFDSIISIFNTQIVCKTVNIIKDASQIKSFSEFHNEYQNSRGEYDAFIRDYKRFAKETKEKLCDLNISGYFEMPNQLSHKLIEPEKV